MKLFSITALPSLLWLIIVAGLSGCVTVNVERRAEMPVASVRAMAPATPVAVEGVVTVAAGTLDEGFALQDQSGGIYVTRAAGLSARLGERVRVSGRIVLPNGQLGIEPATAEPRGQSTIPTPQEIKTGMVGPLTEGRLVAIRGRLVDSVVDDQPWGWKLYLDDGSGKLLVFIATATKIDLKSLRAGQSLRVVGFSGRYEQHTEVLPRFQADLQPLAE